MKFNNNKPAEGDFQFFDKYYPAYNKTITNMFLFLYLNIIYIFKLTLYLIRNDPFPSHINPMKISKNSQVNQAQGAEHIYREFFIGHQ